MMQTMPKTDIASISLPLPMSVHDYMAACAAAYYAQAPSIGAAGDFTTAPEISQMFGEVLAAWLLHHAQQQNLANKNTLLVECGPGRGVLMADMLRVFHATSPTITPVEIHLIETSHILQQAQHHHLAAATDLPIHWHASIDMLPQAPLLLVANEFFDCLPIHQYRYAGDGWQVRHVVADDSGGLAFAWQDFTPPAHWPQDKTNNAVHEFAPAHADMIAAIAKRIAKYGGAGLIVDYGRDGCLGDSLQAVSQHRPTHPLKNPGATDITAWVNFSHLAETAHKHGTHVLPLQTQGDFLREMGIQQRAEVLAEGKPPAIRRQLASAIDRLTSPAHMGEAFKVMAILPSETNTGNTT